MKSSRGWAPSPAPPHRKNRGLLVEQKSTSKKWPVSEKTLEAQRKAQRATSSQHRRRLQLTCPGGRS